MRSVSVLEHNRRGKLVEKNLAQRRRRRRETNAISHLQRSLDQENAHKTRAKRNKQRSRDERRKRQRQRRRSNRGSFRTRLDSRSNRLAIQRVPI